MDKDKPFKGLNIDPRWFDPLRNLNLNFNTRPTLDTSHFEKLMEEITPTAELQADTFQEGIQAAIEDVQAQLNEDEELLMYYTNGLEFIRVLHVIMSSTNVAVLVGLDQNGGACRVVAHFQALQFVCKVVKIEPQTERKRTIGFTIR